MLLAAAGIPLEFFLPGRATTTPVVLASCCCMWLVLRLYIVYFYFYILAHIYIIYLNHNVIFWKGRYRSVWSWSGGISCWLHSAEERVQCDLVREIWWYSPDSLLGRGLRAIDAIGGGLREEVLSLAVPVTGRVMHQMDSSTQYQPYGKNNTECNYSISRYACCVNRITSTHI